MRFITARDLRNKASELWSELSADKEIVVTVNGRPVALITGINDEDLEDTLRVLRRTRAQVGLARVQRASLANGLDKLTAEDIDKEIKAVRRSRKR